MHGLEALGQVQFGLVSRAQAIERKISLAWIRWKLERGELEHFQRGVYRFRGTSATWSQYAMGALLMAGAKSALSHQTAAFLFKLDGFSGTRPTVLNVTTMDDRKLALPRVIFHRTRDLDVPTEIVSGLTTTSRARTLVDLATVLESRPLEIALDSARRSHSMTPVELEAYLATISSKRWGLPLLKELLASRQSPLDSRKEVDLLHLIMERGLPAPRPGYSVYDLGRYIMKVDFAWLDQLVALHFDSYRYHHHRVNFERDARQRSELAGAKWQSVIVTDRSLASHEWSDALKRLLLL